MCHILEDTINDVFNRSHSERITNLESLASDVRYLHRLAKDHYDERVRLENLLIEYRRILWSLASAWYYGGWEAETPNEAQMEQRMTRLGFWPITETQLLKLGNSLDNENISHPGI